MSERTEEHQSKEIAIRIVTNVFKFYEGRYDNLSELSEAMGVSVSQIYRVKQGKRHINEKFIVGAIKAFPDYRLDELFYLKSPSLAEMDNVTTLNGKPR